MSAKPVSTSSPSATRSTQRSGAGSPRSAATSRPLGASSGGRADEPLAVDVDAEPGGGLDALDDRWSSARCSRSRRCTSVLAPARARRGRAASARRSTATPRATPPCSGRSVKHGVVGGGGVAEPVPPDRAVVAGLLVADLGGVGVAGVREAGAVGQPGHRRGPGVGEGVGEQRRRSRRRGPGGSSARRRRWRCRRPPATPSGDGSYQSIAEVTSPDASAGSMSTRPGPSTGSSIGRTTSAARSRSPQRSMVKSWSPRTAGERAVPAAVSSASRSRNRPRSGTASRAARVRSFWAVVHARTSGEEPSSSQRYGSATSIPWRTSVGPSARVAGGGGTSAQGRSRYELRPRLGLRPWLAFFLRARWVAFFVRFDIGRPRYRPAGGALQSANLRGMDAASVIEGLRLAPHPEGGHYRETWRHDPGPTGGRRRRASPPAPRG